MVVKYLLLILLSSNLYAKDNAPTTVFHGQRFTVYITDNCPEGYVDCQNVDYYSINNKTKQELRLKGETWYNHVTGDYIGYSFKSKNYLYTIRDSEVVVVNSTSDKCTELLQLNVYLKDKLISHDEELYVK